MIASYTISDAPVPRSDARAARHRRAVRAPRPAGRRQLTGGRRLPSFGLVARVPSKQAKADPERAELLERRKVAKAERRAAAQRERARPPPRPAAAKPSTPPSTRPPDRTANRRTGVEAGASRRPSLTPVRSRFRGGRPMLDCVIKGGTVVDGTGAPGPPGRRRHPRRADRRDRRRHRGRDRDDRRRRASWSRPGIVDPHTHYDAQLFWDPAASPSNLHGVTSMIAGNCGFTLAPIAPADADYLRRMMAKVEGMPLPALETGVPWNWQTFADYLGALDGQRRAQRRVPGRPLRAAPQRDGRRQRRQRSDARAARRADHPAARVARRGRARLLDHACRSRTPTVTANRSRRAGPANDEVLALCRGGERARGHDARVRDRRLPARLHRRRGRADGRDDARRPPAAQLERAHDRLEGAAALPRPGRGVRERARDAAAPSSRSRCRSSSR